MEMVTVTQAVFGALCAIIGIGIAVGVSIRMHTIKLTALDQRYNEMVHQVTERQNLIEERLSHHERKCSESAVRMYDKLDSMSKVINDKLDKLNQRLSHTEGEVSRAQCFPK